MSLNLPAKIVRVHEALRAAGLSHAFGGALALAFCTAEPRATKDIDVNVFIPVDQTAVLLEALPEEITLTTEARAQLRRDGQARSWWQDTPVDLFLSNHPFHDRAEANRNAVPFAGIADLPVLACEDLAVFKAFYARPKDAVDIATMVAAGSVDLSALEDEVSTLLGGPADRSAFFGRVTDMVGELS
jgi:hypothetical protein